MSSSPSRSHSGAWVPVPAVRSEAASPAAEFRDASGRSACSALRWAKSGPASQLSTNAGQRRVAAVLEPAASASSASPAQPAIGLVLDARVRPDEDEALDELAAPRRARCRQQRPPSEYPT